MKSRQKLRAGTDRDVITNSDGRALQDSAAGIAGSPSDTLVGIMLVFASVMAAAMLYNAMSANISPIATENFSLVLVAIPFGVVSGVLLTDRLLSTNHSLGYPLRLEMQPTTPRGGDIQHSRRRRAGPNTYCAPDSWHRSVADRERIRLAMTVDRFLTGDCLCSKTVPCQ